MTKAPKFSLLTGALAFGGLMIILAIAACTGTKEFESYGLVNQKTGEKVHCLAPAGTLQAADIKALNACIAGWQAKGFVALHPEKLPGGTH